MKRLIIAFTLLLSALILCEAQPPQALKYKSIAKDEWGVALPNKDISLQFTFLQDGIEVYREIHNPTTNKFGLMDVNIGEGTAFIGVFSDIDWGAGTYTMRVELDPSGGTDFRLESEDRLLSVPYALYAGNITGSSDNDPDPENELISDLVLTGSVLYIIDAGQTHMIDLVSLQDGTDDADADPTNELQDLSLLDNYLSISYGSTVDLGSLTDLVDDADADPLNEIQDLQLQGNILTITGNNSSTTIDLSQYLDNTDNQQLTLNGNELSIQGGNSVVLTDLVDDADAEPTNELQDINLSDGSLSLSNGNTVDLGFVADGYEPDTDNQTLSVDGYNLSISDGNTVVLPDEVNDADNDPTNEIQTLSIEGSVLTLSDGGVVELALGSGVGGVYMYADEDEDGYGNPFAPVYIPDGVTPPVGYITQSGDCDDENATIHPGAFELCDGLDNDCDGYIEDIPCCDGTNLTLVAECTEIYGNDEYSCIGYKECTPSGWGPCILPEEICGDGIDNDCDGVYCNDSVVYRYALNEINEDLNWIKTGEGGIINNSIVDNLEITRDFPISGPIYGHRLWCIEAEVNSELPISLGEAGARLFVKINSDDISIYPNQYHEIQVRFQKEVDNADNFIGIYNSSGILLNDTSNFPAKITINWNQNNPRYRIRLMRVDDTVILATELSNVPRNDISTIRAVVQLNNLNFPVQIGSPMLGQIGFGNMLLSGNSTSYWENIQISYVEN